jgi:hypothetical protein
MPAVFTHFLMCDKVTQDSRLPDRARGILRDERIAANWGAIGPDYLFFYPPDWTIIGKLFDWMYRFEDVSEEALDLFEMVSTLKSNLTDLATGGLYREIGRVSSGLRTTLMAYLAELVTRRVDLFELVKPPMLVDYGDISRWWWIDIAHHSRTMEFARHLWEHTRDSPRAEAYALGYLTHVGGDAIGHPYVNALVGGPYRHQWRRHAFIERVLDTHLWHLMHGVSVSSSNAFRRIHFPTPGYLDPDLPDELAVAMYAALVTTYDNLSIASGIPGVDRIKLMYSYMYKFVRSASQHSMLNLPEPPDFDFFDLPEEIRRRFDDLNQRRPPIGPPPIFAPTDVTAWKAFFRSLFAFCLWAIEAVITLTSIPVAALLRLATTPLRYVLWCIQKLIYELYDKFRLALATAGFIHPEPRHVRAYFPHIVAPQEDIGKLQYPYEHVVNDWQTYHLVHPSTPPLNATLESVPTVPFRRMSANRLKPERVLLETADGMGRSFLEACRYATAKNYDGIANPDDRWGSAVDLSVELIRGFTEGRQSAYPNWNLDGDRGFGWPTWYQINPKPWLTYDAFRPDC